MPYVLLEWQLASSRALSILPSIDALHSHFAAHNTAILEEAATSHQPPPLPLPPPTFLWSNILAPDVLPLLTLPDTNLPPLPGIELPKQSGEDEVRVLARHCWTHTTQSTHKVLDVMLLPIELILLDDEDQSEDRLYLAGTINAAETETAGETEAGAAEAEAYQFGMQWELYEQSSKMRAVHAAERLCEDFVMTRLGGSKRSVFVNDSEIGRDTARFMQTFTPFEFNTQTVSTATTSRSFIVCRLEEISYSTFVPACLSLCAISVAAQVCSTCTDTSAVRSRWSHILRSRPAVSTRAAVPRPA